MPVVTIPTPLRSLTGGLDRVSASGTTVLEALNDVSKRHPGLRDRIFDGDELRRHVNVYVNNEDIRFLERPRNQGRRQRRDRHHPGHRRRLRRGVRWNRDSRCKNSRCKNARRKKILMIRRHQTQELLLNFCILHIES